MSWAEEYILEAKIEQIIENSVEDINNFIDEYIEGDAV